MWDSAGQAAALRHGKAPPRKESSTRPRPIERGAKVKIDSWCAGLSSSRTLLEIVVLKIFLPKTPAICL